MDKLWDTVVNALGGSRYLELAYSLRHDNLMMTMYTAEYAVLCLSTLVIGSCLIAKRGRLTGVNQPAASLYGLNFLAVSAFYATNGATLISPIFRLDVIVGGFAAMTTAVTAGLTVWSLFGYTPELSAAPHHA